MSAKNKLMLIQYCNIIITWNFDPETPILCARNDPKPYFLHKVYRKNMRFWAFLGPKRGFLGLE